MKWILVWFAVGPAGQITSGSAPFASLEACSKAKDGPVEVLNQMSKELLKAGKPDTIGFLRSMCANTESGEWHRN